MTTPNSTPSAEESAVTPEVAEESVIADAEAVVREAEAEDAVRQSEPQPQSETVILSSTINTLARSVETLAGTVESLAKTSVPAPPAPVIAAAVVEEGVITEDVTEAAVAALKKTAGTTHLFEVIAEFAKYAGMFLGIGLLASAVVHISSSPVGSLAMGAVGAVLFVVGSTFKDLRAKDATVLQSAKAVGSASLLAVGIAMVTGGIQYFGDFPGRASVLIPVGLALSVTAFVLRNNYKLRSEHITWLAAGAVWVLLIAGIGLHQVAEAMEKPDPADAEAVPAAGAPADAANGTPNAPAAPGSGEHGATAESAATQDHGAAAETPAATEHAPASTEKAPEADHGAAAAESAPTKAESAPAAASGAHH